MLAFTLARAASAWACAARTLGELFSASSRIAEVSPISVTVRKEESGSARTRPSIPTSRPRFASLVATAVRAVSRLSCELPSVTSERRESERVALPARSFATETVSCSSARRRLARRTRTSSFAASAPKKVCLALSVVWYWASRSPASAAVSVARAASIWAPRRKPVKRSTDALKPLLMLCAYDSPEMTSPVIWLTREGPFGIAGSVSSS